MRKLCGLSLPCQRYMKTCIFCLIGFFIIESIIFNTVVLYIIWNVQSSFNDIMQAPGRTFLDKLAVNPFFASLIYTGKEGGFSTLLENTIGRIYIESVDNEFNLQKSKKDSSQIHGSSLNSRHTVSRLGIDVSSAGEAMYILERIQNLDVNRTNWEKLIVDIGANDGLLSSNSYNFIRWGWSAILVEPQSYQLDFAKRNLHG